MNKEKTIYELLGLIKDGQAPNRILYDHYIWSWTGDDYHTILKTEKEQFLITGMYYTWVSEFLNDKVEIIEEDNKTEYENVEEINYVGCKVDINIIGIKELFNTDSPVVTEHCIDKINQLIRNQKKLIDEVNKLKENK